MKIVRKLRVKKSKRKSVSKKNGSPHKLFSWEKIAFFSKNYLFTSKNHFVNEQLKVDAFFPLYFVCVY